jgi:hypothetical protein
MNISVNDAGNTAKRTSEKCVLNTGAHTAFLATLALIVQKEFVHQ